MSVPPAHRFVCIHGHFYQPPRENPWLEAVEIQDSAAPVSRLERAHHRRMLRAQRRLPHRERAERRSSASSTTTRGSASTSAPRCSPGCEEKAPRTYRMILRCRPAKPRALRRTRLGHGAGLQPHHHAAGQHAATATRRSAGASPTSSTASAASPKACGWPKPRSTCESLDLLARAWHPLHHAGSAPVRARQIAGTTRASEAVRDAGWAETPDASVDTTRPYLANLPGHSIAVFFYNGPVSRAIAFEGLLNSGEVLPSVCWAASRNRQRGAAGPRRHRRRELRPSSPARRDGARLCAAADRRRRLRG